MYSRGGGRLWSTASLDPLALRVDEVFPSKRTRDSELVGPDGKGVAVRAVSAGKHFLTLDRSDTRPTGLSSWRAHAGIELDIQESVCRLLRTSSPRNRLSILGQGVGSARARLRPSLVWSTRSAPLKSPVRSRSVCVASSRDAWSPASAERWSNTADRRPSSEADTSRIIDRSGSVVAVAASWFTSVASRSIDDSTSVHRADDMVAGVPMASSAATRSCNANPWELAARARERQARASRRREAIRAKISATTITAIATRTQIHGEVDRPLPPLPARPAGLLGRRFRRLLGRRFGRLLGRRFGRLLGRRFGRLRSSAVADAGANRGERRRGDGDRGDCVRDARPDLVAGLLGTRGQ